MFTSFNISPGGKPAHWPIGILVLRRFKKDEIRPFVYCQSISFFMNKNNDS